MTASRYPQEVRERSDRMVLEQLDQHVSLWSCIESVASKIGCSAQLLQTWVRHHEIDHGQREGVTTAEGHRIKQLEGENNELRRATHDVLMPSS